MKTRRHNFYWDSIIVPVAAAAVLLVSCASNEAEYDATGTFEATELIVSAEAVGQLQSFSVTEGQQLSADAVVGTIDAEQLRLQRTEIVANRQQITATRHQLEANKAAADSKVLDLKKQVAAIEQQIANARSERRRFAELVAAGAAPQKQVDDYDNEVKVLQRQLDATLEQIGKANAGARSESVGVDAQIEGTVAENSSMASRQAQVEDRIGKAVVRSPAAGTVLEKYVEAGEYVTVGKPLFKLADLQDMYLRAYITSGQIAKVHIGSTVKVFANYGNGNRKEYRGTVTWISGKSEFTPKTILTDDERADLVYAVKIRVKNDGNIKIGMYGEMKL